MEKLVCIINFISILKIYYFQVIVYFEKDAAIDCLDHSLLVAGCHATGMNSLLISFLHASPYLYLLHQDSIKIKTFTFIS